MEFADWFRSSLSAKGYSSVNSFLQRHLYDKNLIYGVANGTRFVTIEAARSLAGALERPLEEIEPIWWRAKDAMDRSVAEQRDSEQSRLTSWDKLPLPNPILRNFLEAQADVVEQLPYRLLGVQPPPLSTIYVRQHMRQQDEVRPDRESKRPDALIEKQNSEASLSATEALNRHEHLLVTGEPGAGKSTLGYHFARQLSGIWLRTLSASESPLAEPVMPLRISARALINGTTWSVALAQAAQQAMGLRLIEELAPRLFEGRIEGARWLIFIDGLDEIVDGGLRRTVIQAIARHARPGSFYRFLITTRPLPDSELAPLRAAHMGNYTVERFGRSELKSFAGRWFYTQNPETAEAQADIFISETSDGRIQELVRNPLLATIAAIARTREPSRPLPNNRIDLYHRFYDYLIDDEISGRDTLHDLVTGKASYSGLAGWIHGKRSTLIDALARVRLDSEESLLHAAASWVRELLPSDLKLSPGWEGQLRQILIGTGMFVYEGDGLRFLHHSFAEFLAARAYADLIAADFPDMEEWIRRGLNEAERNLVIFVFGLWGRQAGHDICLILRRLLQGNQDRMLLAGRVLAEGISAPSEVGDEVIESLINVAMGSIFSSSAFDVLASLKENTQVHRRLIEIIEQRELPSRTRIEAAIALGQNVGPADAVPLLHALADEATPDDLKRLAAGVHEFIPDDPQSAEWLVLRYITEANPQDADLEGAMDALIEIGSHAEAVRLAKRVLEADDVSDRAIRSALRVWLTAAGENSLDEALHLIDKRPTKTHRGWVAETLCELGYLDQSLSYAREAVADPETDAMAMSSAVRAWASGLGSEGQSEVIEALRCRSLTAEHKARISVALAELGWRAAACDFAAEVIGSNSADEIDVVNAGTAWINAEGVEAASRILAAMEARERFSSEYKALVAELFAEKGCMEAAVRLAKTVVCGEHMPWHVIETAIRAWGLADPSAGPEIYARLLDKSPLDLWDQAYYAEALAEIGATEEAALLARDAITRRDITEFEIGHAVNAWMEAAGLTAVPELLAALPRSLTADKCNAVATALARQGALPAAIDLWLAALTAPWAEVAQRLKIAKKLLDVGARDRTIAHIDRYLASDATSSASRTPLRAIRAWLALSDPSESHCGICSVG
ncbi:NACHT domain-containing protein [Streptosporangium soli]|nr:hypothetical protein [Streptosporangium sp. KLBMP 9127]